MIEQASRISVAACDRAACGCGYVYVRLHDDDDRIFAAAGMSPQTALLLASELVKEAEDQIAVGYVAGHA